MKKLFATLAALFFATTAYAQNPGTVASRAFVIGKGPGFTGFTSVLCTQAQIAIGQNAANPICATLSGDVTMTAAGITAIGANKVTNAQLATAADGTVKSNISGGVAAPSDNTISAVLDKLLGTTRGSVAYRGASAWTSLAPGTSGFALKSNGPGADPTYQAAGSGTVTSVGLTNTYGLVVTGSPVTGAGNLNAEINITRLTNSLGADVALSNVASTYTAGPTVAQGSIGTWFASGTVSLTDTAVGIIPYCRLSDGTNIVASTGLNAASAAGARVSLSLSGLFTSPPGNIRIECANQGATATAAFRFNMTGNSKDNTLTAIRLQ